MAKPTNNTAKIFRKDRVINLNTSGLNLSTGTHVPVSHVGLIPALKEYPLSNAERLELAAIVVRHHAISTESFDDKWFGEFIGKLFCKACKVAKPCKLNAFEYFTIQRNRPICFKEV